MGSVRERHRVKAQLFDPSDPIKLTSGAPFKAQSRQPIPHRKKLKTIHPFPLANATTSMALLNFLG